MTTSFRHAARFATVALVALAALGPAAARAQTRTVRGVVRDCVIKLGIEAVRVGLSSSAEYVATDSAGRFTLEGAPKTAFVLSVRRVGYAAQQYEVYPGNDTSVTIALRPAAQSSYGSMHCEMALDDLVVRTLTGFVRDAATNEPIGRAQVTVQGSAFGVFTTAAGAFRIVGVQRDSLVLTAKRIGYQSSDKYLVSGGDTSVTFYLRASATLRPRRDTIPLLLEAALRSGDKLVPRVIPDPRPH